MFEWYNKKDWQSIRGSWRKHVQQRVNSYSYDDIVDMCEDHKIDFVYDEGHIFSSTTINMVAYRYRTVRNLSYWTWVHHEN